MTEGQATMTIAINENLLEVVYCELNSKLKSGIKTPLSVVQHNRQDKERQTKLLQQQYEFVSFGNEYDSVAAILAIYPEIIKSSGADKTSLIVDSRELGIDIFANLGLTDVDIFSTAINFGIIEFETYLELDGNKLCSLGSKYVPYIAVEKREKFNYLNRFIKTPKVLIKIA